MIQTRRRIGRGKAMMNRDKVEGRVLQFVGAFRERWGKLIGDQTLQIRGERDQHRARLQVRRDHDEEGWLDDERAGGQS